MGLEKRLRGLAAQKGLCRDAEGSEGQEWG